MIVCSQCHHQNPDTLSQCEACFADLSSTSSCPTCGHHYLDGTKFCGQCGTQLEDIPIERSSLRSDVSLSELPELSPPEPEVELRKLPLKQQEYSPSIVQDSSVAVGTLNDTQPATADETPQWETPQAALIHQDTQLKIQLGDYSSPIRLGKPNHKAMPDINLATFKHAEVVSRIHADILIENSQYLIQDNGSANGTYVNETRIKPGKPRKLVQGDKISLGKGDLVTFTFELS